MRELAPGVRVLEPTDYRRMRWKNGRGWTTEIAVHPADAGFKGKPFDWRVSLAEVERACEFSPFPGYDRSILLAAGAGMQLSFDVAPPQRIQERYSPFSFRGEWQAHCRLLEGPVRDFNVVSRRGKFAHRLEILRSADLPRRLPANDRVWLVHVFADEMAVVGQSLPLSTLAVGETLLAREGYAAQGLRLDHGSAGMTAALVSFAAVADQHG